MDFFRKRKKNPPPEVSKSSHPPKPQASVVPEPHEPLAQLTTSTDSELTPAVVEEPSSIFARMVLSSSARKQEGQGSPYLTKGSSKAESEPSAFEFLSADTTTGGPSSGGEDGGDEGIQEGTSREGRGGEEEKSAFSFISREPPELPEESQESGFSFLCSVDPPHGGGESEEKKEGAHVSEHVDSSQTSQEAPPLSTNSSPPIMTPKPAMASARLRDTNTSFQTSSGAVSPVPGPISPPLTSHPTSGATSKPSEGGRTHVGKQQPSANKKKKKKRKITRPGQERTDDPILIDVPTEDVDSFKSGSFAMGMELDSVSLASQASSTEPGRDTSSVASSILTEPQAASYVSSEPLGTLNKNIPTDEQGDDETVLDSGRVGKDKVPDDVPTRTHGSSGEGGSGVNGGKQESMRSELLVDITSNVQEREGKEGREEEGNEGREEKGKKGREEKGKEGRGGGPSFQDEQMLSASDSAVVGGGEGREGDDGGEERGERRRREEDSEGEKVRKTVKEADNVNYSVKLTPCDKLTLLIQSSESNLARIRLDVSALHTQKQSSLDQHISAANQQRQNRHQMKELRAREAKALSEEDYELAEELRGELETASQDSSWSISNASHTLLREWLQEVCKLIETEESVQSDIRTQLSEMRDKQNQALTCVEEEIASTHTKQKMKLKALEDKMDRERGHIALDKEHLQKREQQLQDEIASRAEKFISKKSTLQEELKTVHSGISELEKKLAELRQEEVRLQAAISEEEGRIEAVHHELDSENCSLREERDSLTRREQELQAQQSGVEEVRQGYEVAQVEEQAKKQSIKDVLGRVDMKWVESERRSHTLVQCLSRVGDLRNMDTALLLSPSQHLQRHREEVGEREERVRKVAGEVVALQDLISQLRRQITHTQERLPQLEEAKKAAVAARQYKEAGRVSSELKQLRAELEPQRKQLSESEGEVSGKNKQLATLSAELAQEREGLEQEERQEDVEHLRQLASALAKIKATKTSIPGSSSPLAQVLDSWHQLYQLLADGLCAKHDLELADFTPHMEEEGEGEGKGEEEGEGEGEEEGEGEGRQTISEDATRECRKRQPYLTSAHQKPPEERTPGVGQEEEEEEDGTEGGREGEGEGSRNSLSIAEIEEVKKKIAELESRIEEAVSEEVENYELAADLDRELSVLKEKLASN